MQITQLSLVQFENLSAYKIENFLKILKLTHSPEPKTYQPIVKLLGLLIEIAYLT